ncbi:MAG: fluoride efflux transporter CrcB [Rhodobacteraceae bacterium]|uniref:fluoride efflux transporter CrcB n=1 Tax=Amaricoccus sp. B4 TaxID=3368557 RepID=UPI000DABE27A|nr:fluoride efflux transporter CrcB [Paracoccaceae bacterium]
MPVVLQVALGGALGATLRHLCAWQITRQVGNAFPWGTLCVNVVGSFIMGIAAMLLVRRSDLGLQHMAPFFMTGILGGFTTFSAFSLETVLLVERGRADLAFAYVAASVVLGLAAFAGAITLLRGWATA